MKNNGFTIIAKLVYAFLLFVGFLLSAITVLNNLFKQLFGPCKQKSLWD